MYISSSFSFPSHKAAVCKSVFFLLLWKTGGNTFLLDREIAWNISSKKSKNVAIGDFFFIILNFSGYVFVIVVVGFIKKCLFLPVCFPFLKRMEHNETNNLF